MLGLRAFKCLAKQIAKHLEHMQTRHLFLRNNTYYCVARIPQDLTCHFPVKTVWRSLKTKCQKSAMTLLKKFHFYVEKLYMQIRTGMLVNRL